MNPKEETAGSPGELFHAMSTESMEDGGKADLKGWQICQEWRVTFTSLSSKYKESAGG